MAELNTTPRDTPEESEPALSLRQTINAAARNEHGDETVVLAVMMRELRNVFAEGGDPTRCEIRVTQQVGDLLLIEIIAGIKP